MNLEAKLEEYRQVCADHRQLYDRRDQTLYLAFIVFTGIIGIGIQWKNPILFIITSFILLFLWCNEILRQIAIYRYDAYIEVIIKKYIQGLERTTLGKFHPYRNSRSKYIPYLSLPFLVVICFKLGIYYFTNYCNQIISYRWFWTFEIISFIFFIILVIRSIRFLIPTKYDYRKKEKENWEKAQDAQKEWEEKQKELKDKNKSTPQ